MDVDEIWRFELVRGFSNDVYRGACLLTAISWLIYGRHNDRPVTSAASSPDAAGGERHIGG